ncbi:MAG: hypothetical protein ACLRZ9_12995 [Eubacterium sp.]
MHYISYDYYANEYCGGEPVVIAADFPKLLIKAQSIIDLYTFNKIRTFNTFSKDIKYCCCELVEVIHNYNVKQEGNPNGVSSEKNKNYSITYESSESIKEKFESETKEVVFRWLESTGLLYRGC